MYIYYKEQTKSLITIEVFTAIFAVHKQNFFGMRTAFSCRADDTM